MWGFGDEVSVISGDHAGSNQASSGGGGGRGGNGRVIIRHGVSVNTRTGTISNAELTTCQPLPARPFVGLLVS